MTYNAFAPNLQLWVAACLYWGYRDSLEKFSGPLMPEQHRELFRRARPLATTLRVPPEMWPDNIEAFDRFREEGLSRPRIDETPRDFLTRLTQNGWAVSTASSPPAFCRRKCANG